MSCATIPPILASLIARIIAALPATARTPLPDLLLGAAVTKGGHVTHAILASLIARLIAAVPARARTPFLDLLLGAAVTKGGHVTDAILAGGLSRGWRTYYWFLERGRWSWLRVWAALLEVLTMLFRPAVW